MQIVEFNLRNLYYNFGTDQLRKRRCKVKYSFNVTFTAILSPCVINRIEAINSHRTMRSFVISYVTIDQLGWLVCRLP